jgi:hypothetical protein
LLYAVPVIAFVIAWVWLEEIPSASGGVLAFTGVVLVNTLGRDQRRESARSSFRLSNRESLGSVL